MSSSAMTTPVFTYDPWERYVMTMEEIDARKKRITAAFNASKKEKPNLSSGSR